MVDSPTHVLDPRGDRKLCLVKARGSVGTRVTRHPWKAWGVAIVALASAAMPHAALAAGGGSGSISLTTLGSASTQDFNTLANTGSVNNLTVGGWYLNETGTSGSNNGQYRAGTGSDNTGDTYSFGAAASTERAFGTLFSGTLSPTIGAQFTNATGSTITSLDVSYTGEMWRAGVLNRNAADRLDFQLSTDATSLTNGTWVDHDGLDYSSSNINTTLGAVNGNAMGNRTSVSLSITGLSLPNGASFWIRWNDSDVSPGADDGLAVDDFAITPNTSAVVPNLTITDVSASEGNAGTTAFSFSVNLSSPAGAGGVTFDIATQGDTATSPSDFTALSLTGQTIPAGSSSYSFIVPVNGDLVTEPNERFFANVTNVTGAAVADGQGEGTIVNDDAADAAPVVASRVPVDGATGFPVGGNLSVTFSEPVDVSASWFTLACSTSGTVAASFSGGPTTFTLDPGVTLVNGETCTLTVLANQVSDQDGNDPPDNMAVNSTASFAATHAPPQVNRAGYCLGGKFLDLVAGQPDDDPLYTGAVLSIFVKGKGITCDPPPPGYTRQGGTADSDNVGAGTYAVFAPAAFERRSYLALRPEPRPLLREPTLLRRVVARHVGVLPVRSRAPRPRQLP